MDPVSNIRFVMSNQGAIAYDRDNAITVRFDRKETDEMLKHEVDYSKHDHFCEVAHLEISNNCNMKCSYCYVPGKDGMELDTDAWKKIIVNLARSGVFQVSFGGGEPTLRGDLFDLAKWVKECGMNLGMTTNGVQLVNLDAKMIKEYFKQVNVSWHQDEIILARALQFLSDHNIPRGINYAFSKDMSLDNEVVKKLAKEFNAEVLYLVYKPVIKDIANQVSNNEVYKVAKQSADEGLSVAVDGPCVNKCLMKRKFIDVNHMGEVYPCSFVRKSLGNLLNNDFKEIWAKRGEQDKCPYVKLETEES